MSNTVSFLKYRDVADFRNGLNFSKDSHGKGCLLIGIADFKDYFSPQWASIGEINPSNVAKKEDYLKKGDIIFVRSNGNKALVGRSLYIDRDVTSLFSGFCIRARLKTDDFHPLFLAYFSKTERFRSSITSVAGTNINNLNQGILGNVKIPLYPKDIQKSIVDVLSSIDKKIALNNSINTKLEAMAKTLYDYWFVQFDFPDANGKPYKTSGGKMVYNTTLKRDIPVDWTPLRLNELLSNCSESISPKDVDDESKYTPIDALPMKKMSFGNAYAASEANSSLIKYMKGDILIGAMRVYFHRVCIAPFNGITRTTSLVLRPKKASFLPYIYQVCNEDRFINTAAKISVGTQQPYVNWDNALENIILAYPSDDSLISKYSSAMRDIVNDIILREKENAYLEKLRNWLLPLLISGQVTVR
ncbi:restriction endonuclease subunit S [Photorhabdus hindustanensis]|uniref:Restriction endonuclease subunit S n=1 Tax=Photorhabdus hindustanensis TaxID=2918802 RepID=A0A2S8Q7H5_9GAMM|nr:restriction endonuclease subunit S [Photorhabdus hindustanensis]PQQ28690.1 restriction endonuclease subunit S [Photorhabdus hindustanensis]